MRNPFRNLNQILRGEATSLSALRGGTLHVPVLGLSLLLIALAAVYGGCMGFYGLFNNSQTGAWRQVLASMAKVPALFILTLLVTFPSLYVFNALVGSRLTFSTIARLMAAAMAVLITVLASFGPIVAFFSVTTPSHPFILLLNVFFCALSGFLGMLFLFKTLHRLTLAAAEAESSVHRELPGSTPQPTGGSWLRDTVDTVKSAATPSGESQPADGDAPIPPVLQPPLPIQTEPFRGHVLGAHVKTLFRCWVLLFALVGCQMSWVLRPFIGEPDQAFHWFEKRGSNFFMAVWQTIVQLLH